MARSHSQRLEQGNNLVTFAALRGATVCLQLCELCAVIPDVMKTFSTRIASMAVIITAFLVFYPSAASATTVTVTVGNNCLCFSPDPVMIQPGDTVHWTWSSSGHSSTSGPPCSANGMWDSGILNQGQMFSHTFNMAGTYTYECEVHVSVGMTGTVVVQQPVSVGGVAEQPGASLREPGQIR